MSWLNWFKQRWPWRRKGEVIAPAHEPRPLREFVYLDEVSLRSLLSSQKGAITESLSSETSSGIEAQMESRVELGAPALATSELSSRFQTSNSSTLQTSRKATVQSWFVELFEISDLKRIEPFDKVEPVSSGEEITHISTPSSAIRSNELARGDLVEFKVKLAADPVFKLETMVTEFAGMAEDYPEMFSQGDALANFHSVLPVNKILQRLLAGLIPIKALAVHYRVITIGDEEYVVHENVIENLDIQSKPLQIVGVTEHLAYWKDIRRVLFSDGEFTLLCRIARPGLHATWTPVKLADLFRNMMPQMVEQISSPQLTFFDQPVERSIEPPHQDRLLERALQVYAELILEKAGLNKTKAREQQISALSAGLRERSTTVSDQFSAFAQMKSELLKDKTESVLPETDLALREEARQVSGLSYFPSADRSYAFQTAAPHQEAQKEPRLLDVEIIAIYW